MTYEATLTKAQDLTNDEDKKHAIFWLFQELLKIDHTKYFLNMNEKLTKAQINEFNLLVNKYLNENIPVQYLVGHSYFYGRKFYVTNETLIPRNETELLILKTINLVKKYFSNKKTIEILDLATGTGCIGITIKLELNANVTISDISKEALRVASKNAKLNNASVKIVHSDWFTNIEQKYDLIISNPPYIPLDQKVDDVVLKEPHQALYSGILGIDSYETILKEANNFLSDNAIIAFEHGYDQKQLLKELSMKYFKDEKIIQEQDLANKDRYTFIIKGE